jgi:hypothetical protein
MRQTKHIFDMGSTVRLPVPVDPFSGIGRDGVVTRAGAAATLNSNWDCFTVTNTLSGWQRGGRVRDVDGHMRLISSGEKGDPMAAIQRFSRLISADSHVYEPHDLWWKALGQKFVDRMSAPVRCSGGPTSRIPGRSGWRPSSPDHHYLAPWRARIRKRSWGTTPPMCLIVTKGPSIATV